MADAPRAESRSWRPALLLLVLAPLLLGLVALLRAGGGLTPDPGIDWTAYPPSVHDAIDLAAKNADCAGLAAQRALLASAAPGDPDPSPVVAYIATIERQLVCPR